jgi:hypothetical protein
MRLRFARSYQKERFIHYSMAFTQTAFSSPEKRCVLYTQLIVFLKCARACLFGFNEGSACSRRLEHGVGTTALWFSLHRRKLVATGAGVITSYQASGVVLEHFLTLHLNGRLRGLGRCTIGCRVLLGWAAEFDTMNLNDIRSVSPCGAQRRGSTDLVRRRRQLLYTNELSHSDLHTALFSGQVLVVRLG